MEQESVGLIGVGLLGTAIAQRLLAGRWQVFGYDLAPSQVDALAAEGGTVCQSAAEVLSRSNVVVLSLPNSNVSAAVVSENLRLLRPGQTLIDTTTGSPEEMIAISERLRARGAVYVEATVAGSSAQVRSGDACLFVGGDDSTIESIQGLLATIASKRFHLGPVGTASRFKLVHNLVLGLHRAVLAEGLSFAKALGFEPAHVLDILKETPAASAVMESKGKKMVTGDREPQARLSQHLKDVRLIVAAAEREGLKTPLSRAHQQLLEQTESLGFGDADNSAVIEAYNAS